MAESLQAVPSAPGAIGTLKLKSGQKKLAPDRTQA